MLELIKKNYVNMCIVLVYTAIAALVYGIWSYSAWKLWYVTFIIVLVIVGVGMTIGFFWIWNDIKKEACEVKPNEETIVQ